MELLEFKKNNFMLRLTRKEGIRLVRSLSCQIDENDPNTNRDEYYPEKGAEYFSITVLPDASLPPYWKASPKPKKESWDTFLKRVSAVPKKKDGRKSHDRKKNVRSL